MLHLLFLQFLTHLMVSLMAVLLLGSALFQVVPRLLDGYLGVAPPSRAGSPTQSASGKTQHDVDARVSSLQQRLQQSVAGALQQADFQCFLNASLERTMSNSLGPSLVAASADPDVCRAAGALFLNDTVCAKLEQLGGKAVDDDRFRGSLVKLAAALVEEKKLQKTVADGVLHTLLDDDVRGLLKGVMLSAMGHEQLHASMVKAIRAGFTAAVQDDELTQMGKRVLIEMLSDARFHRAILKGAMGAIKAGVRDALRDEELVEGFKETLVDALQDEELHKAGMQGAFEAMLPDAFKKASSQSLSSQGGGPGSGLGPGTSYESMVAMRSSFLMKPKGSGGASADHLGSSPLESQEDHAAVRAGTSGTILVGSSGGGGASPPAPFGGGGTETGTGAAAAATTAFENFVGDASTRFRGIFGASPSPPMMASSSSVGSTSPDRVLDSGITSSHDSY